MTTSQAIRKIFLSFDFIGSALCVLIMIPLVPSVVPTSVAKEFFGICISVLAIVFSVFFAALAVFITSGDNEFVKFLEEEGAFTRIIWSFRVTLLALFVALILSIALFISTLQSDSAMTTSSYPGWIVVAFAGIAIYAMLATVNSCLDAIKYAEFRARFIKILESKKGTKN